MLPPLHISALIRPSSEGLYIYISQHVKKMLYIASEGLHMLVFSLELRANTNMP
jgi:hypothetical protein